MFEKLEEGKRNQVRFIIFVSYFLKNATLNHWMPVLYNYVLPKQFPELKN